MRFESTRLLYLLLLLPVLGAMLWLAAFRRRRMLERFAGGAPHAERFLGDVSSHVRATKGMLLLFAAAAGIVAAARPQWGTRLETVTRKGLDVVLVIDTSQSMAARDVPPDRLSAARHAAGALVDRLPGDRVALVTFAGAASLACPLTLDQEAIKILLDAIDVEIVPVPGTALADALRQAVTAFGPASTTGTTRGRALILFTDGEDHEGGIEDAEASLKSAGVTLYAVGCGTRQGAPIPLEGAAGYKKDSADRVVTTKLDETLLESLALATGGRYYRATPAELEIEDVAKSIGEIGTSEAGTVLKTRYEERYQLALGIALAALVAEMLLPDRKRRPLRAPLGVER